VEGLVLWLVQNGRDAGLVGLLLAEIVLVGWLFGREHVVLGTVYRRDTKSCETDSAALEAANAKMGETAVVAAAANVRLEFLTRERDALSQQLSDCRAQVGALQSWRSGGAS